VNWIENRRSLAGGFASGAVGGSGGGRNFTGTLSLSSRRGQGEKQRQKQNIQWYVVFDQSKLLPVHSQHHVGNRQPRPLVPARSQKLPTPRPALAIPRMRLPLDSGPNNFLTALINAPNSRSATCILSAYAELENSFVLGGY
jgi:hypothetical protein